ncbi:acylneuraminate cytidylyltransferase family protein [Pontibacter lucknowensis]|uniref:N-acylneuraminate cytidylyltransferase n=1 Tax=Pontibacter lucknowensis TaxID=1077936 RepID=A0A1N6Y7G0_9BACT|nr:acylneuraminate cytidylyltransferase [Pontibacter lucknowensis]SIR10497.1 N-acylneuraminate cytidylyltransferase [Pontibacter lucknowensis]
MKRDICFFLPTRKGSQRVKSKNTRRFSNIEGGILELKLRQLLSCKSLTYVILSTNDELSVEIAQSIDPSGDRIRVILRPEELCLDTTPLSALISYVPGIVLESHIIWGHTTTPFVDADEYDKAIGEYFGKLEEGYDSLVSVSALQNFILDGEGQGVNFDTSRNHWPRTQDLPMLYEINHAMFITSREVYLNQKNRVGAKPYFFLQDKIRSFDIDWEDDFIIAEAIYDKLVKV